MSRPRLAEMSRTSRRNCACFGLRAQVTPLVLDVVQGFAQRRGGVRKQRHDDPCNRQYGEKRELKARLEQRLRIAHQQHQRGQRYRVEGRAIAVEQRGNLIGNDHQHRAQDGRAQFGERRIAAGEHDRRQDRILSGKTQPAHQPQ